MKARVPGRAALAAAAAVTLVACADPVRPTSPPEAPAVDGSQDPEQDAVVAGQVIVKLRDGARADAVERVSGLRVTKVLHKGQLRVLGGAARGGERLLAARLAADPNVEYAEPNYIRRADAIDPRLWAFTNAGGRSASFTDGGGPLPSIYSSLKDADEDAIQRIAGGRGRPVVVGVIDTGVDMDHQEFTGRLIAGRDWIDGDDVPEDDQGHGTHVAGTIGGSTVGVAGVTGAAPHVKIHVQRVCFAGADGAASCPTDAIVNAIYAAADYPGMVAINLSLGGTTESAAEQAAILYATRKGVLVVAAAGNSGGPRLDCPACDANAIAVAATNWRDALAYYSSYGEGLDIAAPGGELYSGATEEMGIYSAYLNGGYAFRQGTSMAVPQVVGAAAVVASKVGLLGAELRSRLLQSADDRGAPGYDTRFGNGRLNVYRAVTDAPANVRL